MRDIKIDSSKQQIVNRRQRCLTVFYKLFTTIYLLLSTPFLGKKCVQPVDAVGMKMWMTAFYTQLQSWYLFYTQKLIKSWTENTQVLHSTFTAFHPLHYSLFSTTSTTPIITTKCFYEKNQEGSRS